MDKADFVAAFWVLREHEQTAYDYLCDVLERETEYGGLPRFAVAKKYRRLFDLDTRVGIDTEDIDLGQYFVWQGGEDPRSDGTDGQN